jgi:hypothetical protein
VRFLALAGVLLVAALPASAATLRGFENQFRGTAPVRQSGPPVNTSGGDDAFIRLLLYTVAAPFVLSSELPEEGYSPGLYAESRGDAGDAAIQQRFELSYQRVGRYVGGWGGRWNMTTEKHIGLEAFWTDYIEHREEDLHYVGASGSGDFWREDRWRANYQLGLAALSGRLTRVGPRLAIEAEGYPRRPLFFDASAGVTLISGGPLGELRAGGGLAWGRAQVRLSYRALIGPFKNLAGPELSMIFRL